VDLTIEIDREEDGRWIAEVIGLPGVMVYGRSRREAIARVQLLAFEVLAERSGRRHANVSSAAIQSILNAFDLLSADEQREAAYEILRRTRELELPPLDDETIDRLADESFREYDAREAADAEG
jgi:predicted RNase H-like HicB family nuclease